MDGVISGFLSFYWQHMFHFETFSHWYIELLLNVYIHVIYQEYMSNCLLYTPYISAQ